MITDEDSLREWMEHQPREAVLAVALRAALRVMPLCLLARQPNKEGRISLTALPVCRVNLSAAMAFTSSELSAASCAASSSASLASTTALSFEAFLAPSDGFGTFVNDASLNAARASFRIVSFEKSNSFSNASAFASIDASLTAFRIASASYSSSKSTLAAFYVQIDSDARQIDAGRDPTSFPLWHTTPPDWFTESWAKTQRIWDADPAAWDFWRRWYQGIIDGTPMPDALLHDIALIPDDIWQAGPQAVADRIALIEERHRLLAEVTDLKAQLAATIAPASVTDRSHNNPPELIDGFAEVRHELVIVWAALAEAEEQLAKPDPKPSTLKRAGKALVSAAIHLAAYCARLGHTMLEAAAKEFGTTGSKWAIRAGAGWLVLQAEPVRTLGQQLIDFAARLAAGG